MSIIMIFFFNSIDFVCFFIKRVADCSHNSNYD